MKTLVVFSSRTGNTEKICRAAAEVCDDCEIVSVSKRPAVGNHDLVIIGFWVDRGIPDEAARNYIAQLENRNIVLLGTLGAYPDSDHAMQCKAQALEMASRHGNNVLGIFMCQGKVDPAVLEMMRKVAADAHPMTEERKARIAEAAKHPDEEDCQNVKAFIRDIICKLGS